ncbi:hypothetical protein OBBRIDRAFT_892123 [Obba rivulosa]|uniref:G domain-containing protein n=1 Tax=Obba rivulosa TaxID=1052685 RepID=A0A8E2DEL0_9APHY|nr:hypothetical protein OBBRIDRAFT_892123 [Obba rivulosa]
MPAESARSGEEKPVIIALMGATGSGKSTFVNTASKSTLQVGTELVSCTDTVQVSQMFGLRGRKVILVDTPGFDDTEKSEADILGMIALWLATTYENGYKLSGIIFMHRITDIRIGGVSRRNFRMFRQLCGEETLKNVVIVTNMWANVTTEDGEQRERELMSRDIFFKPALAKGARMARYYNTYESALAVLSLLVDAAPRALRIQTELVDERKELLQTAAGAVLGDALAEQAEKHRREMHALREEMEEARRVHDAETHEELAQVRTELEAQMKQAERERELLRTQYARDKQRADEEIRKLRDAVRQGEAATGEREAQVEQLEARLEQVEQESALERERLKNERAVLQVQSRHRPFILALEMLANLTSLCRYSMATGQGPLSSLFPASQASNLKAGALDAFIGAPSNGTLSAVAKLTEGVASSKALPL